VPAVKGGNYGGVSAPARQEERRRRLLAAGLEVIGTDGLGAASVRAVCREAGLSSRFFYESFSSLEELAITLTDEIFQRATESVLAAVGAAPPETAERNRVAIETFVRGLTDDPRVARFVLTEALGSEALILRRLAFVRSAVEVMLDQKRADGPAAKSETYREVAATVLVGGLIELLVAWMHGAIDNDLSGIVRDYVELAKDVAETTGNSARRSSPASSLKGVAP
jgi:AcrR family transcriptional regulator